MDTVRELSESSLPHWISQREVVERVTQREPATCLPVSADVRGDVPVDVSRLDQSKGSGCGMVGEIRVRHPITEVPQQLGTGFSVFTQERESALAGEVPSMLPRRAADLPVLVLVRGRARASRFEPNDIEDSRLGAVVERVVLVVQRPVGIGTDRSDPFAAGGEARDASTTHLPGVGQAQDLELRHGLQMNRRYVAPALSEVLNHKPAVAVFGCWLAAKQHGS